MGLLSVPLLYHSVEGNGNPLQDSCLENSMDRGAWWTTVHGVAKSGIRDVEKGCDHLAFLGGENPLEKEMAIHYRILAWKILWTEEPGGLQSMGSQRGGHDLVTNSFIFIFHIRW